MIRQAPLVLALIGLAAAGWCQGELEAARHLVLNLCGSQFIESVDVAQPPAGIEAAWALKIVWEQGEGRPEWGHVGLPFRADLPTGYAFDIYVEDVQGPCAMSVYLNEADGDRWVESFPVADWAGGEWHHVDLTGDSLRLWQFGDGQRQPETIGSMTLEPSGKDSRATIWIADVGIHTRTGLQGILPLMRDTDCPPATSITPAVRLPAEPRCYMGTGLNSLMKQQGREFVTEVHKLVPNLGVAANGNSWRPEWRERIEALRGEGIDVRVQNGGIAGMRALITQAEAWGVDPQGRSRNETPGFGDDMHGVSYCHPATREAVRRMMAAMRGIGVLDFMQIDYVWPWQGGPWGYGEWDLEAFRSDLAGLDEGLRLADGRTVGFWEYLGSYGTGPLSPEALGLRPAGAAVGLESPTYATTATTTATETAVGLESPIRAEADAWASLRPGADNGTEEQKRRRHFVFVALTHYEWLKFGQSMGAESRSWGGQFMATMNPEDVSNGGDYLYWNRLADTGTAYFERFGNPAAAEQWRHYIPYLREAASRSGKRLGVIYEVGVGGHGKPYLDPEVAYCQSYDCTASGQFDDMQNEWMDEAGWTQSQEGYHRDRLDQWLATARGFSQAKADAATMQRPKALAIGHRCVVHGIGYEPSYLLTRTALTDLNIDCDFADLAMPVADWEGYDVIVYTPWESSQRHLEALRAWLQVKPGRTLITHGAVPTRIADGQGFLPGAQIGDGSLGRLLGLGEITKSGAAGGEVTLSASGLLPGLSGRTAAPPGGLFSTGAGEPLARAGGQPLVTQVTLEGGGRVVYLNYAAGQAETRDLDGLILGDLLRSCGGTATVDRPADVYCHTYDAGPGRVAVLWARSPLEAFNFEYRGDLDQRLAYAAEVDLDLSISARAGTWRVYDYLADAEQVVEADDAGLPFRLQGRCCAVVYYGPDTPEWAQWLQRVKVSPRPGEL